MSALKFQGSGILVLLFRRTNIQNLDTLIIMLSKYLEQTLQTFKFSTAYPDFYNKSILFYRFSHSSWFCFKSQQTHSIDFFDLT